MDGRSPIKLTFTECDDMDTTTVDSSVSNLPVPAAQSGAIVRRDEILKVLVKETPGQRLGVSRSYFLALVEKHDLSLEEVDTMVVGLRKNQEFDLRPSIAKMAELLSLGATVEEIEIAYWARETIARELGGSPLNTTSALWTIIECMRVFLDGGLDGEEFGRKIAEAYQTVTESGWRIRTIRRVLELILDEAKRSGGNQLETIASTIAKSKPRLEVFF